MNLSFKNVLCVCCLLLSGSVYAQVPQDLIDKAKAAECRIRRYSRN